MKTVVTKSWALCLLWPWHHLRTAPFYRIILWESKQWQYCRAWLSFGLLNFYEPGNPVAEILNKTTRRNATQNQFMRDDVHIDFLQQTEVLSQKKRTEKFFKILLKGMEKTSHDTIEKYIFFSQNFNFLFIFVKFDVTHLSQLLTELKHEKTTKEKPLKSSLI